MRLYYLSNIRCAYKHNTQHKVLDATLHFLYKPNYNFLRYRINFFFSFSGLDDDVEC